MFQYFQKTFQIPAGFQQILVSAIQVLAHHVVTDDQVHAVVARARSFQRVVDLVPEHRQVLCESAHGTFIYLIQKEKHTEQQRPTHLTPVLFSLRKLKHELELLVFVLRKWERDYGGPENKNEIKIFPWSQPWAICRMRDRGDMWEMYWGRKI